MTKVVSPPNKDESEIRCRVGCDEALVVLKPETGLDIQKWTFDKNFIVNKVHYFQYENSLLS